MKRILAAAIAALGLAFPSGPAQAQSGCPSIVNGAILTAAQWNACFAAKNNTLGFTPINKAGDTMTGQLVLPATTTAKASLNVPAGTAPTSPINGDFWTTTAGVFARVNGVTVQLGVANGITALTGDVTASGTGSVAATLATVNSNVGTFGDSSHVGAFTVNAKGLITAASSIAVTPATIGAVPTSRTVTAGTGLTGGGALSGDITLTMANTAVAAGPYGDSSHSGTFTVDAQGRLTAASSVAITPASIAAVPTTRTISTATGLAGGGDLSANRTIDYDIPSLTLEGSVDPLNTYALCETAGVTKKCTAGSIASAATAGVSSLGGATGALSLSSGLSISGSTLTSVWSKSGSDINFIGGKVGIGTASPTQLVHAQNDQNAGTLIVSRNDTSGVSAAAGVLATYGNLSQYVSMTQFSPTYTAAGILQPNSAAIYSDGNTNGLRVFTVNAAALTLGTNLVARVTVTSGGAVGIGTPTPANLLVVGPGSGQVYSRIDGGNSGTNDGSGLVFSSAGAVTSIIGNYSAVFGGAYNGLATWYIPNNLLISSGNVGIANPSPSYSLDIARNVDDLAGVRILNNQGGANANPLITFDNGTNKGYLGVRSVGSGTVGILTPNDTELVSDQAISIDAISGPIKFSASGGNAENMRIATTGKVGIGTTAPVALLSVGSYGSTASTNSASGAILSGTTSLGTSLNAVNYVAEFRDDMVNEGRLLVMGYRRTADGSWPGASWRLQNAIDSSFTEYNGGRTYIEFSNSAALYFGLLGADVVTINTNGVGIGKAPTYPLDVNGVMRSDYAQFKNGMPWADVRAWGALCNSSHDDQPNIQNAIDYLDANFAGGFVFIPPGNCLVESTVVVKTGVILMGSGARTSSITLDPALDTGVIFFDNTVNRGGLRDLGVYGKMTTTAANHAITVAANAQVDFMNCIVWGGNFGIYTSGVDGTMYNCFVSGWNTTGGGILSQGANWYDRVKLDTAGPHTGFAFRQGTYFTSGVAENHFLNSDFTGDYDYSVFIDDANTGSAIIVISDSVLNNAVYVNFSRWVALIGNEMNGPITNNAGSVGPITISSSMGLSGIITLAGGGTNHVCGVNFNIVC